MNHPLRKKTRFAAVALTAVLAAAGLTCATLARPSADAQNTEANITRLTAGILARSQFAHNPLDKELAALFLNRYLELLDGRHTLFLSSDVREFNELEPHLARATVVSGDTRLAHVVWKRYLKRLEQQNTYVRELLAAGEFSFEGKDSYQLDRSDAPRPDTLAAAQELWRQRVRAEYLDEKLDGAKHPEIVRELQRRYDQQLRTMGTLTADEVTGMYLDALASVYDPHSEYLGREEMQSLEMAMNLSLFGIGASLEMRDGYCTVRDVLPGGPASRSPLKPGDRIIAVAQGDAAPVDITNLPLSRAVQLIRGPKGSRVTLTVLPASASAGAGETEMQLTRDEVKLEDQEAKASLIELKPESGSPLRLGVVDLPSFYAGMDGRGSGPKRSVSADVARLLKKLKAEKVHGVLLDLRRNGGGSLEEAIRLTGLFVSKGPIVQTRDAAGDVDVENDTDSGIAYAGPLVVLTSRMSASASEILAGALQDYGRAVIVGDTATFGKGTVQTILPLAPIMEENGLAFDAEPGALKVTIRKFYRPSGASTQLKGIASDLVIPSVTDVSEISESALDNPLPWDSIRPAPFERSKVKVKPFLPELRARSSKRVAAEPGFEYIRGGLEQLRKRMTDKEVSLNEAQRRQERAREEARETGLQAWWKARDKHAPPSHEIRLKSLSAGALAPAVPFAAFDATDLPDLANGDDGKPEPAAMASAAASDMVLDEAVHILADYVRLLAAGTPSKSSTPAAPSAVRPGGANHAALSGGD